GSSRVPLVRATVREAFCNPELGERARSPVPLLHEPDRCVGYGAALRAATHGTRYVFPAAAPAGSLRPDLELHLTSPVSVRDVAYRAAGVVRTVFSREPGASARTPALAPGSRLNDTDPDPLLEGGSVRIRPLATGLVEEAFLDARGTFAQDVE